MFPSEHYSLPPKTSSSHKMMLWWMVAASVVVSRRGQVMRDNTCYLYTLGCYNSLGPYSLVNHLEDNYVRFHVLFLDYDQIFFNFLVFERAYSQFHYFRFLSTYLSKFFQIKSISLTCIFDQGRF